MTFTVVNKINVHIWNDAGPHTSFVGIWGLFIKTYRWGIFIGIETPFMFNPHFKIYWLKGFNFVS